MNYIYSATTNSFYPLEMKEDYTQADSWPDDAVEVDEQVYIEFSGFLPFIENFRRMRAMNRPESALF